LTASTCPVLPPDTSAYVGFLILPPVYPDMASITPWTFSKSVSISDSGLRAIQDEAATVWADADKITRVIRNLTDNAATYTPEGGEIEIGIETGPEAVSVYYTNNAGDVSPDDLPYLFERFYRGEKSRSREHGGAGIGLAIVNELIKSHGGSVDAGLLDGKIRIGFSLPKGLPPA